MHTVVDAKLARATSAVEAGDDRERPAVCAENRLSLEDIAHGVLPCKVMEECRKNVHMACHRTGSRDMLRTELIIDRNVHLGVGKIRGVEQMTSLIKLFS